jgi:hypothetical protein
MHLNGAARQIADTLVMADSLAVYGFETKVGYNFRALFNL